MSATPGGYASKAARDERADKVKRLYADGVALTAIAERLGLQRSMVAKTATQLGLREPRAPKK